MVWLRRGSAYIGGDCREGQLYKKVYESIFETYYIESLSSVLGVNKKKFICSKRRKIFLLLPFVTLFKNRGKF